MLEAAVEAKKHIFCEKPMGVDLAGVDQRPPPPEPKPTLDGGLPQSCENQMMFVRGETLRNRVDTRAGFGIG